MSRERRAPKTPRTSNPQTKATMQLPSQSSRDRTCTYPPPTPTINSNHPHPHPTKHKSYNTHHHHPPPPSCNNGSPLSPDARRAAHPITSFHAHWSTSHARQHARTQLQASTHRLSVSLPKPRQTEPSRIETAEPCSAAPGARRLLRSTSSQQVHGACLPAYPLASASAPTQRTGASPETQRHWRHVDCIVLRCGAVRGGAGRRVCGRQSMHMHMHMYMRIPI